MTTTSTTNYIDVDPPSICPSGHHHLDICSQTPCSPCSPPPEAERMSDFEDVSRSSGFYASPSPTSETRRLLKKTRREPSSSSSDAPADPREVLAREEYNHIYPQSPSCLRKQRSFAKAKVLLDKLTKCKRGGGDDRWVCVEVTHKVTQHVLCQ